MACTSLEEHANTLQQTLSLINFEYKEFVCDYQVYDIADCYVTKSTGEIFVFTCKDGNCYLELNNSKSKVKRIK